MDFDEDPANNERLRSAIVKFYQGGKGIGSAKLIQMTKFYFEEQKIRGNINCISNFPDSSTLTKYRSKSHIHLGINFSKAFWQYFRDVWPSYLGINFSNMDDYYRSLTWFYQVNPVSNASTCKCLNDSRFDIYHFSENFAKLHPESVVLGRLVFGKAQDKTLKVDEFQSYDGRLGKSRETKHREGVVFEKNQSICLFLKSDQGSPKMYVFNDYGSADKKKITWMKGDMINMSAKSPVFQSNAYAVISEKDNLEDLNIYLYSEVESYILGELKSR